jgi:serine/threonine protein kinase
VYGTTNVAIKICRIPLNVDKKPLDEILSEVSLLLTSQNHPNVVRLYGVCRLPEGFGFVTERCTGSLQTKIQELGDRNVTFLTVREMMLTLMLQIAEGLASLHAHNILHLDLKPANVLLSSEGPYFTAKICDFGLSRFGSNMEDMSYISGTPAYMALELLTPNVEKGALSTKVDVWALGVTFWSMVELRQPFEAMNIFYIASLTRRGDRLVISCPDCVHKLRLLIEACWQSVAGNRPTAKECAENLKIILTTSTSEKNM